jgi:hypothetical protein
MTAEIDIQDFVDQFLTCKKTGKIYNIPAINQFGQIFELDTYYEEDENADNVTTVLNIKSFISTFLEKYPQYSKDQYIVNQELKNCHVSNIKKINYLICSNNFDQLKNYNNFSLKVFSYDYLNKLVLDSNEDILLHFINNIKNNNDLIELIGNKCYFVNMVCKKTTNIELIKILLEKINQMSLNNPYNKISPLMQILIESKSNELDIYAIDKHVSEGLPLNLPEGKYGSILSYTFTNKDVNIIMHILDKLNKENIIFRDLITHLIDCVSINVRCNDNTKECVIDILLSSIVPEQ